MSDLPPIGLIPAAGEATRLGAQPSSKEVLVVGGRPATGHLLERFRLGGIERAVIVVRSDKEDIEATLGDGQRWGVKLDYVETAATPGVPQTLDVARDALKGRLVALGFPDILFRPASAFAALVERQRRSRAELVLGLFPTRQPEKTDMVRLDEAGRPVEVVIKDPECRLELTWSIALWTPVFTDFLHRWVAAAQGDAAERWVGDVIQASLEAGLAAEAVTFAQGQYLDIGTPEDLASARAGYGDRP